MRFILSLLMNKSPWSSLIFWIGAVLFIVLATVFYQPAAAKTGSLLIWMNQRIYVMDIDTLTLKRVGPAGFDDLKLPAPGCLGQTETPCWIVAGENLYRVDPAFSSDHSRSARPLAAAEGIRWLNAGASWSPDGQHLAYTVFHEPDNRAELRIYNAVTGEMQTVGIGVDPAVAPAWTTDCAAGLKAVGCEIAFKLKGPGKNQVVAFQPATETRREWELVTDSIFGLRWSSAGEMLYSQPKRYFHRVEDQSPAYHIPAAAKLANMSPDGRYTVYYQPFTLTGCDSESCLYLGVWLTDELNPDHKPRLIYNVKLAEVDQAGLNFIPVWAPGGEAFVFFQAGNLIYYDLSRQEATIWYKSLRGKLRCLPVFSPNEEAVAFVDNQGQGFSEYRLVVINPRLRPVEHIINTRDGFQVLAWLPNY